MSSHRSRPKGQVPPIRRSTLFRRATRAFGGGPLGRSGAARQRLRADDARRLRGPFRAAAHGRRRRFPGNAERGAAAVQSGDRGRGVGPLSRRGRRDGGHLKSARFEHLGQSLGESLPTLRAQLATMQIETDGLSARIDDLVDHLERPRDTTMLRVLETKAAAGDTAIGVTSAAMRACGGAAFSKHMIIERLFRDAHAGAVMAPTGDVLREFIARAILGMPLF